LQDLDRLLRTSVIKYGVNLDVVKCVDGKRETFTPTGRAYPASVWDFYENV
jgi:lysine-specific demethylase/histidyl-hydroxylase NO66